MGWETFADAPETEVVTDASLCQQIFGNLVSNAIKYTPRGGHVRVEGSAGPTDWCVSVIDDGTGIPVESLERVFEPFFRLARDEHSRIEGNGLGLSICRELTEQVGGSILLDSTPGVGTTVKVHFPRNPARGQTTGNIPRTSPDTAGRPETLRMPHRSQDRGTAQEPTFPSPSISALDLGLRVQVQRRFLLQVQRLENLLPRPVNCTCKLLERWPPVLTMNPPRDRSRC